ncbi:STAS domain-containing protein [Kitasatospora camelliae]|uniref:STAS domain-containing protein n=1 Tax=Kitasatospora camelliae TaxID=3156397 RepID=A0AAU8JT00_9ACTN
MRTARAERPLEDQDSVYEVRRVLDLALAHGRPVELDLPAVTFCDSAGLRVMLGARERAASAGTSLRIRAAGPRIRHLLDITETRRLLAPPE